MLDHSQGKIFLAGERGLVETETSRTYFTFNFGSFYNPFKTPVASLYVLNDVTLAAHESQTLQVEAYTDVWLLPVVGAITYRDDLGHESFIEAGQVQQHAVAKNSSIRIANPYSSGLVNFIQFWFKRSNHKVHEPQIVSFDLDHSKNQFIELFSNDATRLSTSRQPKVHIGKFNGRQEVIYKRNFPVSIVFVFVLQGAFEVQYRLLEAKDGLAIQEVNEVEIEALSNDAILVLTEMPAFG